MKTIFNSIVALSIACICLTGCLGYESKNNETIGQVKKAQHATPVICADYLRTDISLGAMVNGVGSMSKEDMWLYVPDAEQFKVLEAAVSTGKLVRIHYDVMRASWCVPTPILTSVEVIN